MARAAAAVAAPATTAGRAAPAAPSRRQPAHRKPAPAKRPTRRASGQAAPSRAPGKAGRSTPRRAPGRAAPRRAPRAAPRRVALPLGARMLDAVLSGRIWIGLVGVLLAGIVFFNVDLLRMNREITHMADKAAQLKRENGRLRQDVAGLANSERIQQAAAELGLVLPAPAEVRYLKSNPTIDARTASKRIIAPDPFAAATTTPTTTTSPTSTAAALPTG
jgi:cell division protein FtsL